MSKPSLTANKFKNDGSFLEEFKRRMDEQSAKDAASSGDFSFAIVCNIQFNLFNRCNSELIVCQCKMQSVVQNVFLQVQMSVLLTRNQKKSCHPGLFFMFCSFFCVETLQFLQLGKTAETTETIERCFWCNKGAVYKFC